jgi:hypothetical protein
VIAETLAAVKTPAAARPCIVGRWLATLTDDDRTELHALITHGNINTIRRAVATDPDTPYKGSHAPWHKHFTNDCTCHRT